MYNLQLARRRHGFTLIELLIVVAIIAILAAIAVPNFLEAQVRSKVSRVKADMRSIATAMEAYFVDYNSYPGPWERPDNPSPVNNRQPGWSAGIALSTPTAFITTAQVRDPFLKYSKFPGVDQYKDKFFIAIPTGNLRYDGGSVNNAQFWPRTCFGLVSFGPDQTDDTRFGNYPFGYQSDGGTWIGPYDTTNGTKSRGDIFRCAPKAPASFVFDSGRLTPGQHDPFSY